MAEIAPFPGIRFDVSRVGDLQQVVAPPYDVISKDQLEELRSRSPYNIVHIDLPNPDAASNGDLYLEAGRRFRSWLEQGILLKDTRPALYAYHQLYRVPGTDRQARLRGFVAAVRLARWDEGVILPHERTFAKPKEDRMRLMEAAGANLSQVYAFYADEGLRAEQILEEVTERNAPTMRVVDGDGAEHKMWVVDDPKLVSAVQAALQDRTLYIADGHHRYETALEYRDRVRAAGATGPGPADYVMMMLVNSNDGGLTVLPTHRMISPARPIAREQVQERLERYFSVSRFTLSDPLQTAAFAMEKISDQAEKIALIWPDEGWVLTPRGREVLLQAIDEPASPAWKLLGATILHRIVLERCFGMDRAWQEGGNRITYTRSGEEAVAAVRDNKCDVAAILNAPTPATIIEVAEAGDAMPQKSTYFYPKLLTGLVIRDLS